jgi:hypothetical protein
VNEERTGKCLRQVEHIRGHLWHRYSITVNQVMAYLDLHLEIDSEGRLRTKRCDKRDDFNFPIVNFPFIYSNIPAAPAYGVYLSQMIRYSRAYGSYQDFLDRVLLLTRKLLNQVFLLVKLKSSLRKVYGESSQWENWNHLFCRNVSFLTDPHCRFRGVGQGMRQTYLHMWYPLFQAQITI